MIALAVQKGTYVYAYDEKNGILFYVGGTLVGFTSDSLSVKRDGCIFVYDGKGRQLFYRDI